MTRSARCCPLAIAVLLLAGCSDDGEVRSAAPSRSPSVPVSPSAAPPSPLAVSPSPSPSAAPRSAPSPTASPRPIASPTAPSPIASPAVSSPIASPAASSPTAASPRPAPSPRPSPSASPPAPRPSPSPTPGSTSRALTIKDFAFSPRTMTIPIGTAVTATNLDSAAHTWTADGGAWDSGSLSRGQQFTFTFRTPGTFTFHCEPHPTMTGSIVVS